MSDREALIATVREYPDDDLPRMMFADWLDEYGESESDRCRAKFIRAQVTLSRLKVSPPRCEKTALELPGYANFTQRCRCKICSLKRVEYMASRRFIVWDWTGGCPEGYGTLCYSAMWSRGFVESARGELDELELRLDAMIREHPVRTVAVHILEGEQLDHDALVERWPSVGKWTIKPMIRFNLGNWRSPLIEARWNDTPMNINTTIRELRRLMERNAITGLPRHLLDPASGANYSAAHTSAQRPIRDTGSLRNSI